MKIGADGRPMLKSSRPSGTKVLAACNSLLSLTMALATSCRCNHRKCARNVSGARRTKARALHTFSTALWIARLTGRSIKPVMMSRIHLHADTCHLVTTGALTRHQPAGGDGRTGRTSARPRA